MPSGGYRQMCNFWQRYWKNKEVRITWLKVSCWIYQKRSIFGCRWFAALTSGGRIRGGDQGVRCARSLFTWTTKRLFWPLNKGELNIKASYIFHRESKDQAGSTLHFCCLGVQVSTLILTYCTFAFYSSWSKCACFLRTIFSLRFCAFGQKGVCGLRVNIIAIKGTYHSSVLWLIYIVLLIFWDKDGGL